MMEEELTFLCRGILLDAGDSTERGAWVDGAWAIVLEVHGGFLASVSHDDDDGDDSNGVLRDGDPGGEGRGDGDGGGVEGKRGERSSRSYT